MKARVTIEFLSTPSFDQPKPIVMEFDDLTIVQSRPVSLERNVGGGDKLVPSPFLTTVLTGTHVEKPVSGA